MAKGVMESLSNFKRLEKIMVRQAQSQLKKLNFLLFWTVLCPETT